MLIIFIVIEIIVASFLILFCNKRKNIYHSETVKVTDKIEIPQKIGDGQYGTSWWLDKKDYNSIFKYNKLDRTKEYNQVCFESGGVVVNYERENNTDKIYYIDKNIHTLIVGASGSGKSRSIIIPTITMLRTSRRKYIRK